MTSTVRKRARPATGKTGRPPPTSLPPEPGSELAQAHQRLEELYEISQLFATFASVDEALDAILAVAARTVPIHSAILMQVDEARSTMVVWSHDTRDSAFLKAGKSHVEAACAYLVGATTSIESVDLRAPPGMALAPRPQGGRDARSFIVIPLVVAHGPTFGALQLEGVGQLDEKDLAFISALANQLAVAIDRDRARRRDASRLDVAEKGRTAAEAMGTVSERGRTDAEELRAASDTLAGENARLYEEAQKAVHVREQILAVVSHDLKNPLAAILLTAGNLERAGIADENRTLLQAAGIIQRSARRMERLIDDLLDFASIEAGRLAIRRAPVDPAGLIQETLTQFEVVARAKQLHLVAKVGSVLPKANCDRDRLLQVLSNLVGNATKATAEGGSVTLSVKPHGREVLFAVADDGPGISPEDATHLFERYWRGGEVEYRGTGLGLAIARGIVAAHGGRIWVESVLGRGATFFFTVPAADAAAVPGDPGSRPQLPSN
jgi:signal transduction histidine kinase